MSDGGSGSGYDRREVFGLFGAAGLGTLALGGPASAQPSIGKANLNRQPSPLPDCQMTTSDILVETLISWGAPFIFGMVGDGIAPSSKQSASARTGYASSACAMKRPRRSWPRALRN